MRKSALPDGIDESVKMYEDIISKQAQSNLLFDDYDSEKQNIFLNWMILMNGLTWGVFMV